MSKLNQAADFAQAEGEGIPSLGEVEVFGTHVGVRRWQLTQPKDLHQAVRGANPACEPLPGALLWGRLTMLAHGARLRNPPGFQVINNLSRDRSTEKSGRSVRKNVTASPGPGPKPGNTGCPPTFVVTQAQAREVKVVLYRLVLESQCSKSFLPKNRKKKKRNRREKQRAKRVT